MVVVLVVLVGVLVMVVVVTMLLMVMMVVAMVLALLIDVMPIVEGIEHRLHLSGGHGSDSSRCASNGEECCGGG